MIPTQPASRRRRVAGRTRRTIGLAAATFALAAGLVACSGDDDFSEFNDNLDAAIPLPLDAPRVTVDTLGDVSDGGTVLSFRDVTDGADAPQEARVTVSDGFDQSVQRADSVDPAAPAGGDVVSLTLPVTAVSSAAEAPEEDERPATRRVDLRLGVAESTDLTLLEDLRSAEGFRMGWRADDSGQISTVELAAPTGASDEGRAYVESALTTLTSLPVVFPAESVGVGATWSVDSRVTGDATLLQTTTYTVTGIEGDLVDLDVEVTQRPSMGAIPIEGVPGAEDAQGQELRVISSETTSTGAITVDLTRPLPVDGRIVYTTRVVYGGEGEAGIVQDTTTGVEFE